MVRPRVAWVKLDRPQQRTLRSSPVFMQDDLCPCQRNMGLGKPLIQSQSSNRRILRLHHRSLRMCNSPIGKDDVGEGNPSISLPVSWVVGDGTLKTLNAL